MRPPNSMMHMNGNLLCAVDVETTGRDPGRHEIIQIAVQPLDANVQPSQDVRPFVHYIKPEFPERVEKEAVAVHRISIDWLMQNALDKWRVGEFFDRWYEKLDLPYNKCIIPLAQNWQYEAGFLKAWLGIELFNQYFHAWARDTMTAALFINDVYYRRGDKVPFGRVNLAALCKHYGVENPNPHDALSDALAEAEVYRLQIQEDFD